MSVKHRNYFTTLYACGDLRGTESGWQRHKCGGASHACAECIDAHRAYIDDVFQQYRPGCTPTHESERRQSFCEDYIYLIMTGETNAEAIIKRLGFADPTVLERYLFRVGLHSLHDSGTAQFKRRAAA
jgi:hypothetical protein